MKKDVISMCAYFNSSNLKAMILVWSTNNSRKCKSMHLE